jgi:hypothetical protein
MNALDVQQKLAPNFVLLAMNPWQNSWQNAGGARTLLIKLSALKYRSAFVKSGATPDGHCQRDHPVDKSGRLALAGLSVARIVDRDDRIGDAPALPIARRSKPR